MGLWGNKRDSNEWTQIYFDKKMGEMWEARGPEEKERYEKERQAKALKKEGRATPARVELKGRGDTGRQVRNRQQSSQIVPQNVRNGLTNNVSKYW